jgi:aspartate aminotransferase
MKESATLAVGARAAALKAKGVDVVGFGMGEPDFDTPDHIKRAAIAALEAGMTKYVATPGTPAAREAIARKLREENGIACAPEHVSITSGAKHAVFMALQMLIEPGRGDEFLLPTPAWVSYRPLIELAGGTCVEVPGLLENGFRVSAAQVERAITPRTVGILLNSPSNPCGVTYPERDLRTIVDVIAQHPAISVVSDEIYEKLVYPEIEPGIRHWSPGSDARIADRTVTVNGMSKAFAMTGWRIKLQGQMTNNVPSFFMPAIVEALSPASAAPLETMRTAFAHRAALVHELLEAVPRFKSARPTGAFYAFPDISGCIGLVSPGGHRIDSAQAFADALLAEAHVAVVPGEDFGACARTNIRISFACSEEQLRKGIARIASFAASLHA